MGDCDGCGDGWTFREGSPKTREPTEKELLERLLEKQCQKLPAKIERLKEEEPEKALETIKILEKKAKNIIDKIEVKAENFEKVKDYLNYFKNCGLYSGGLKESIDEKINSIISTYKNKMKNLKRFKEELGTY